MIKLNNIKPGDLFGIKECSATGVTNIEEWSKEINENGRIAPCKNVFTLDYSQEYMALYVEQSECKFYEKDHILYKFFLVNEQMNFSIFDYEAEKYLIYL